MRGALEQFERSGRVATGQGETSADHRQIIESHGRVFRKTAFQIISQSLRTGRITGHGQSESNAVLDLACLREIQCGVGTVSSGRRTAEQSLPERRSCLEQCRAVDMGTLASEIHRLARLRVGVPQAAGISQRKGLVIRHRVPRSGTPAAQIPEPVHFSRVSSQKGDAISLDHHVAAIHFARGGAPQGLLGLAHRFSA